MTTPSDDDKMNLNEDPAAWADIESSRTDFCERLAAIVAADDPLSAVGEWGDEREANGNAAFRLAISGHGLVSWRFVLSVRLPTLDLAFTHPLSGVFSRESAHDCESVRALCQTAYAALTALELPDGAVRLSAAYDPAFGAPDWRLEAADGAEVRAGTGWTGLLDVLAGTPNPADENFIRV